MYSLSGMDTPTGGTITFCGTEITGKTSDELAVFLFTDQASRKIRPLEPIKRITAYSLIKEG